ncbi:MAG: hypothetical protein ACP5LE_06355 [Thermoplasmata archaeon]
MGLRDRAKERLAEISEDKAPSSETRVKTGEGRIGDEKPGTGGDIDKQRLVIIKVKQELEARRKELSQKEEEIAKKEAEISSKYGELERRQAELERLYQEVEEKRKNLEEEIGARARDVQEKEKKIMEMEQDFLEKLRKLEEKERAIAQMEETLKTRMEEVAKLEEKTTAAIGEIVNELSDLGITREAFEGLMNSTASETKKLLIVLDELLGELPDEVVDKFAKSPDYKLYEKVLKMYGI